MNGDAFALVYIRDRFLTALDDADRDLLNVSLDELQTAIVDGRYRAAARVASTLRGAVTHMELR